MEGIERLTADLEFAQVQQQILDGLKTGNEALKRIHDVLTIDEVERILDETREGVEKQKVSITSIFVKIFINLIFEISGN